MKTIITPELHQYAKSISRPEHEVLQALREKTQTITGSHMQISADQGQFMGLVAQLTTTKKYLEIGVYTGYSALAVALAIPDNARIYALDINNETMEIAKHYWKLAKVSHKITPVLGDAVESLNKLIEDGHSNTFDMAFIDAQKSDYIEYFKNCYKLVKSGGLILIDNIFMEGAVLNTPLKSIGLSIDNFNRFLQNQKVDYCVTTIGDGLTIVRKT